MSTATSVQPAGTDLSRHDGLLLLSAPEALLKGALESDVPVTLLCGPRQGPFAGLFRLRAQEAVGSLLRRHGMRMQAVADARRALTLAGRAAQTGRTAMAFVPADQLDHVQGPLRRTAGESLAGGAGLAVVIENRPADPGSISPREIASRLDWPVLEPSDLDSLRDAVDGALRLSRACDRPAAIIVHSCLLQMSESLEARPNRVLEVAAASAGRWRRRSRVSDAGGVLRVARRLELNRVHNLPSPGERVPAAFIVVGMAGATLRHLVDVLGLIGRVPSLELRLAHPLDDVSLGRLLTRCEQAIVLEPRPGEVESAVLAVAETLRRRGERPGTVWGSVLPTDPNGRTHTLGPDDVIHPSVLVRRIVHLLHAIRPTLQVASRLIPEPSTVESEVAPRRPLTGARAAVAALRGLVEETNRRLEELAAAEAEEGEEVTPVQLVLEPLSSEAGDHVQVPVEIWEHRGFVDEGVLALVQAAREDRPRVLLLCEEASEEVSDLERLARAVTPADRAAQVKVDSVNFADRPGLIESLVAAAGNTGLTVLVVRDGPPARFDVETLERSLVEVDELGFRPRQTMTCAADLACGVRPPRDPAPPLARYRRDAEPLRTEVAVGRRPRGRGSRVRVSVRPLVEQIDVLRDRPPAWQQRTRGEEGLPMPKPRHGRQSQWRAHLAGFRGDPPGPAARILSLAGSSMGYAVKCVSDATSIAPGRRAWSQVLFTQPRKGEFLSPLTAITPYGEADLVLGVDAGEALRAIGSDRTLRVAVADRTHVVVNTGHFDEDLESDRMRPSPDAAAFNRPALLNPTPQLIDDFTEACRLWFHTDRVTDIAVLGAAFQLGLIPLTLDAMEAAIEQVEAEGFGRSLDAFRFGRRLAADPSPAVRPRPEREESVERSARRIVLSIRSGRRRRLADAQHMGALLRQCLEAMPGLTETDRGRQARRDFVHGLHRCYLWGGHEYAEQYARLVAGLYRTDRGDTGRALTRHLILPLAEAMLIRDPMFVGAMVMSTEQRRRMRHRLNVKHARGDRIVRRFLTRIELVGFGRHVRLDLRTSDWAARLAAAMGRIVPRSWRGSRKRRGLRSYVLDFATRAGGHEPGAYDRWSAAARRLHTLAEDDRLAELSAEELRDLLEPETSGPAEPMPETAGS